jgi:kynurenine formamidase
VRLVDLSVTLAPDADWAPRWARNKVKRQGHKFGAFAVWWTTRLPRKYLRSRLGWANDVIHLSTHGTTHLDAPWHMTPVSEGKPARTIDQVPLQWCYGDGVVLDMRHKGDGEEIEVDDVTEALAKVGHELKPLDIVLIQTGGDRLLGTPEYFTRGPGMSASATRWLLDRGVKVTGIDAWGWDGPLGPQAKRAKEADRDDIFWAAHYVAVDREYCHLERLANLDQVPPTGFKVCCFPLKVERGSAGPARVVAMVED